MRFTVDEMALGQTFLKIHRFSAANIIPPILRACHSLVTDSLQS